MFADNGLQDSQQLPKALVDCVMEAVLVLWKVTKTKDKHFYCGGECVLNLLQSQLHAFIRVMCSLPCNKQSVAVLWSTGLSLCSQ